MDKIIICSVVWILIRLVGIWIQRFSLFTLLKISVVLCFKSIFIESGSSQKSQFGSRKALNPDPDPSYFFTLSDKKIIITSLL